MLEGGGKKGGSLPLQGFSPNSAEGGGEQLQVLLNT